MVVVQLDQVSCIRCDSNSTTRVTDGNITTRVKDDNSTTRVKVRRSLWHLTDAIVV